MAESLEDYDLSQLSEAAEGLTEDLPGLITDLASGKIPDFSDLLSRVKSMALSELSAAAGFALAFLSAALFRGLNDRLGGAGQGAGLVCQITAAASLTGWLMRAVGQVMEVSHRLEKFTRALTPVLTGLLTAMGAESTSASMTALAGLCQWAAGFVLNRAAPVLCCASAALAAAGSLHETLRLKKLAALLSSWAGGLCCFVVAAFVGAAALTGSVASARDGVAMRSAQYAVDNLFPVVGGELSDALSAAAGSVAVLKSAVGAAVAMILVWLCLRPALYVGLSMLTCRAAAALAQPVSDGAMSDMGDGFALAFRALLAAIVSATALTLILIGSAVLAGRAVLSILS